MLSERYCELLFGHRQTALQLGIETSGICHRDELLRSFRCAIDVAEFDDGAERLLAEQVGELEEVVENDSLSNVINSQLIHHVGLANDRRDAFGQFLVVQIQIDVIGSADESFHMRRPHILPLDFNVEVDIGDEDDRSLVLKFVRNRFPIVQFHRTFGSPGYPPLLRRVESRFQQVKPNNIVENGVSVIKHNDIAGFPILIQNLIDAGRFDEAADDVQIDLTGLFRAVQNVFETIRFADAGITAHDSRAVKAPDHTKREIIQRLKALCDLVANLFGGPVVSYFFARHSLSRNHILEAADVVHATSVGLDHKKLMRDMNPVLNAPLFHNFSMDDRPECVENTFNVSRHI